jgi:CDP-ribitol ribitolphosphotransferase / teichoic acid ribitol-phosphate polymerase
MKAVLFCANPYAFGILTPLQNELIARGHDVLWYVPQRIEKTFPFHGKAKQTDNIKDLYDYKSDAIFVPGNEVPHYLRGVKVQVFHGLAGEKKGHFRIRHYFDLYLTQGPYFTKPFHEFERKLKRFEVKETGWCKLDSLYHNHEAYKAERNALLKEHGKKHLVLYAPTFSPSLTSTIVAQKAIFELADSEDIYMLIKFHDLMNPAVADEYRVQAATRKNVKIVDDRNILKVMIMADLMISDTSSVVYEFILLNKPVITIGSTSENINWKDISSPDELLSAFRKEIQEDNFKEQRRNTISEYHPYTDGKSSGRMVMAVEEYIQRNGVPERRKINLYRRLKINRLFGKEPR